MSEFPRLILCSEIYIYWIHRRAWISNGEEEGSADMSLFTIGALLALREIEPNANIIRPTFLPPPFLSVEIWHSSLPLFSFFLLRRNIFYGPLAIQPKANRCRGPFSGEIAAKKQNKTRSPRQQLPPDVQFVFVSWSFELTGPSRLGDSRPEARVCVCRLISDSRSRVLLF